MTAKQDVEFLLANGIYDIQIDSEGDVKTEDFLDTALLMSLFAERRATSSESPNPELRRGWIGNESTPDFEIGSKLWLYEQARITRTILNGIETAISNGLQWFIDDGLAVRIDVSSALVNGAVTVSIDIFRLSSPVEHRNLILWDNTGVS